MIILRFILILFLFAILGKTILLIPPLIGLYILGILILLYIIYLAWILASEI